MAANGVHHDYLEVSNLAKFPFESYWPEKKLKVCVTGAGGFIASHLAKRLKSEGHYVIACDWKRNEHFEVRRQPTNDESCGDTPASMPKAREYHVAGACQVVRWGDGAGCGRQAPLAPAAMQTPRAPRCTAARAALCTPASQP
jgi:hypothetical protein